MKQMHDQRKKDFEFKNIEKISTLNKENQVLLNRLLEISSTHPQKRTKTKKRKTNIHISASEKHLQPRRSFRPRSLNLQARIIEEQKIREENIRMAQRLFDKKPVLDFKSLKDEYVHHKKIANNLKKVKHNKSKYKGRHNHLPPIAPHSKPMSVVEGSVKQLSNLHQSEDAENLRNEGEIEEDSDN